MRDLIRLVAVLALLLAGHATLAQSQHTEHTFKLDDPENRPAATLDDVSWLVGNWSGEAFGNTFEEGWNPPSAGSMIGFFKLMDDDAIHFSGISFYRIDDDTMHAYLVLKSGEEIREEQLVYRRN
jgi:hypothetical protein